jgi:Holliday junction resolvase RusA-like endonuclease
MTRTCPVCSDPYEDDYLQCPDCRTPEGRARKKAKRDSNVVDETISTKPTELHSGVKRGRPCEIVLPWDVLCSVNQRTNPVGGKQYLTERYRRCLRSAEMAVRGQWGRPIIAGPVALTFDFYPPDKRRRDASNWIKLPEDSMTGTVYHDDSQVRTFTVTEHDADRDNPRVEIVVRPYREAA